MRQWPAYISGCILLLSGMLKASAAASFADLMGMYGVESLGYGAPVIILAEVIIGIALVLQWRPRMIAGVGLIFIAIVTGIYAYGQVVYGITDCGCFGRMTGAWTQMPWVVYVRNAVIAGLLVGVWRWGEEKRWQGWKTIVSIAVIGAACYLCGFTLHGARMLQHKTMAPNKTMLVSETPLGEYVQPAADSTYLYFLFSYNCGHCLNSIGNVEQYAQMGVVDRIEALVIDEPLQAEAFRELFQPTFAIRPIPKETLMSLTTELPVAYWVHGDTIVRVMKGQIPSAALWLSAE